MPAAVGLVLTLSYMLAVIDDEVRPGVRRVPSAAVTAPCGVQRIQFHLKIFFGMSVVLLVLVVWFIGELQKNPPPAAEDDAKKTK